MKIYKLDEDYSLILEAKPTKGGFKHNCFVMYNGREARFKPYVVRWVNRTWERFEFENVMQLAIKSYFSNELAEKYLSDLKEVK